MPTTVEVVKEGKNLQFLQQFRIKKRQVKTLLCLVVVCGGWLAGQAAGHGRLIEPPSRASAWRYGFDTPHNYNDHELYCGGFTRQWRKNNGKCGVCGDAWDQPSPRPHELGGRFGQGVIVRKYPEASEISIKVELTASHNGFFEFNVCDKPNDTTQECLDEHLLTMYKPKAITPATTKFYPREGNKIYEMHYVLPENLTCEHCVLQWRYVAGNNWGTCENGTGAVGCGPQEEFRACADVSIGNYTASTPKPRPRPPYVPPSKRPITPRPTAGTPELPVPESSSGTWISLLIAGVTLLCVLLVLAFLYLYYYRGGQRIKNLLKMQGRGKTPAPAAPVRPPRQKRNSHIHDEIKPIETIYDLKKEYDKISNLEPGFENINLKSDRS